MRKEMVGEDWEGGSDGVDGEIGTDVRGFGIGDCSALCHQYRSSVSRTATSVIAQSTVRLIRLR